MPSPGTPSKLPSQGVRTLPSASPVVVGSRCPVCGIAPLAGRQTVCSAACRRERSRQRERTQREARDREIQALLEAALRKLEEGSS